MNGNSAIIAFSHLRWDFVFQRPQHILSRFAGAHRIHFIEEPVHHAGPPSWERAWPQPNITTYRPRIPSTEPGFSAANEPFLRALLDRLLVEEALDDCIAWIYTPMALPLLHGLRPRIVVYDSMDELSAFLGAPEEMRDQEARLLQIADVVFTGGPSLYQAKKDRHPNVFCCPSSVDASHFARARHIADDAGAAEHTAIPRPRLGFYGVIDERMDLGLVDALAGVRRGGRPAWQIVLVGPVVKIDPATLPRHPNLHYVGQRSYEQLPDYLAGWDVCLLPFARNESTRFISPTKILEYMAAERPIVSTPIADVAGPYGDIVYIADTPQEFIAACERALHEEAAESARRTGRMREVLADTSWDRTVALMSREIARIYAPRRASAAAGASVSELDSARRAMTSVTPVVVLGAGPTGLSAAHELGREIGPDVLLLEQHDHVGGWCRSVTDRGFTFDHAGHIMFSNEPYVHELYAKLLGDNVHWQDREAWIYSKKVYTRYPFQGALYGLPPEVIKECIVGAIEARFGSLRAEPALPGAAHARVEDCCADGVLESTAEPGVAPVRAPQRACAPKNFEEFIYRTWGAGIAKHFAIPYNQKLWSVPLAEMETSWLGGRVPMPDLEDLIDGALRPVAKPMGPNARFGYPLRGGFQALMDGFLPLLEGPVRLHSRITRVWPGRHALTINGDEEIRYRYLISTMPLPVLIRLMGDDAPARVQEAAGALRSLPVRCVNIGVGREKITDKHWIYYPEDTVFHRIFMQGNASPYCNPPGGFGLTCEITYSPHKPLPCDGDELIQRCIDDCRGVGILTPQDPIWTAHQLDLPYAYVIYDHSRERSVATIREWLASQDIILAGRYSEWAYYNSDHAFIAGKKAAEAILGLLGSERTAARAAAVPA